MWGSMGCPVVVRNIERTRRSISSSSLGSFVMRTRIRFSATQAACLSSQSGAMNLSNCPESGPLWPICRSNFSNESLERARSVNSSKSVALVPELKTAQQSAPVFAMRSLGDVLAREPIECPVIAVMLALNGVVLTNSLSRRSNELDPRSFVANGFNRQVTILAVNEVQGGVDCPQALIAVAEFVGLPSGSRHQVSLSKFTSTASSTPCSRSLASPQIRPTPGRRAEIVGIGPRSPESVRSGDLNAP